MTPWLELIDTPLVIGDEEISQIAFGNVLLSMTSWKATQVPLLGYPNSEWKRLVAGHPRQGNYLVLDHVMHQVTCNQ